MFKDLALSRESMREYHSKLDSQSAGLKLSAMVLQRSAWPFTVQKTSIDLPPSVSYIHFIEIVHILKHTFLPDASRAHGICQLLQTKTLGSCSRLGSRIGNRDNERPI